MALKEESFKNIVGNGENAGYQHFFLFPQYFLPYQRQKSLFELHLFRHLQLHSIWFNPNFCRLVKG